MVNINITIASIILYGDANKTLYILDGCLYYFISPVTLL